MLELLLNLIYLLYRLILITVVFSPGTIAVLIMAIVAAPVYLYRYITEGKLVEQIDEKKGFDKFVIPAKNLSANPLSAFELAEVSSLIKELPSGDKQLTKLSKLIDTYTELSRRLSELDVAISKQQPLIDGDEFISYTDVNDPFLIYKEYNGTRDKSWGVVPASTRIVDKESLKQVINDVGFNPRTREDFNLPANYKEKATCYVAHQYVGYSEEQAQLASKIRKKIPELSQEKTGINLKNDNPTSQSFWTQVEPAKVENENELIKGMGY